MVIGGPKSSGERIAVFSLFLICVIVVIPCVYSLSRYLEVSVRLVYVCWDIHSCYSGVFLRGNALFIMVTWISYSLFKSKRVLDIGDLVHACCFSLGRCNEPPYLATINLVRPWNMWPNCPGSFRAWMSC